MQATAEQRIDALEREVAELRATVLRLTPVKKDWQSTVGMFADDETFDEAVRLGREYREQQQP
uniref:Uncharacterized protein n=1 Tax=uncultured Verrucomicrobiota bacterium TaxID=156588 RepID=D2DXV6_9BACT|nr:hypothetical protein [uncultured Verrucomicrobiota bacterium]